MSAPHIELLHEVRRLMELKGENPFKVRAFERAIETLRVREDVAARASAGTLTEIPGIGTTIAEVLTEFFQSGTCHVRDELRATLPPGLLDIVRIPGVGPKKARVLIEHLQIKNLDELEQACHDNRVTELKGFSDQAQSRILEGILHLKASAQLIRLDRALALSAALLPVLDQALNEGRHPIVQKLRVVETGSLRRRLETLDCLEFLVELPVGPKTGEELTRRVDAALQAFLLEFPIAVPVRLLTALETDFGYELARTTGSDAHWQALGLSTASGQFKQEADFYRDLKLPYLPPETRETGEEISLAREVPQVFPGKLIELEQIQGSLHNHTQWTDGRSSVEEMVSRAEQLGFKYLGITDHSQSAYYARGLNPRELRRQKAQIEEIQKRFGVRIFWGIESDIRSDGSLDYEEEVLKQFDYVVASVHSGFGLTKDEMTERVLKAVRNPYTRILAHPTGRLLLERKPYEIDLSRVIEEAARCQVALEINAHPARLDLDWRWGPQVRKAGTWIAINPDAHDVEGFSHIAFGVTVARKALFSSTQIVNALSVEEVTRWLRRSNA